MPASRIKFAMPRLLALNIKNYKGIKNITLDFSERNSSPIMTLVGLNESGKTTILEAISEFVSSDPNVSNLFSPISGVEASQLIPVNLKAAFSGDITISARFAWEDKDKSIVEAEAKDAGVEVDFDKLLKNFYIVSGYKFVDSKLTDYVHDWSIDLWTRKSKRAKFQEYQRPGSKTDDFWLKIVNKIELRLPRIVYFPTFLVDLPQKIYLLKHDNETPVNKYYRQVISEILRSGDLKLSLVKHVGDRIATYKSENPEQNWISRFWSSPVRDTIDSVFQKLAYAVTNEVLGSWSKVFQRSSGAKNVLVEWDIDSEKGELPYVSFFVSDGDSRYSLSERSLGFRWFFSFLLFTAFKRSVFRKTIFLFDEPAANLHAKAQAELLVNFSRITESGNQIIYSTHSHHMINPRWLSGAYIVENEAIDYSTNGNFDMNVKPTRITATNYRKFAAESSQRVDYFQPVVETLEYVAPDIVGSSPYILVEGVTDYYALRYIKSLFPDQFARTSIMPGTGAGSCGPLISYMMGRGDKFIVLLDDDKAGLKAAVKYRENWFLSDKIVVPLGSLLSNMKGMRLEELFDAEAEDMIRSHLNLSVAPSKKQIGHYLAEICSVGRSDALSNKTVENLKSVLVSADNLLHEGQGL